MHDARDGQMLLEVILAGSLLVIGALILASFSTSIRPLARHGNNELQAIFLAKEGIEAARSIRDNDYNLLTDGAHGIALNNNAWGFSGMNDTAQGFTRTVTVAPFDLRSKKITSTAVGPHTSSTLATVLLDIDQDLGMAHFIAFNTTAALANGNKELNGMELRNIGPFPITIASITAWWGDNTLIQSVKIGSDVWRHNGAGSPDGKQPSGTTLDIVDTTLAVGQAENNTGFAFAGPVTTVNFIVKFTFTDGSHAYVTVQPQ